MSKKNDILEAWIMVEHLSEGTINVKDKTISRFDRVQDGNYYDLFSRKIEKKKMKPHQKGGIVLYFDVFLFEDIIDFLREKYHLAPAEEETAYGHKFSFALCFDRQLKLNSEMTFLTESYYIRKYREIPKEEEFLKFEDEFKKQFENIFECQEDADYKAHFNEAMAGILQTQRISLRNFLWNRRMRWRICLRNS